MDRALIVDGLPLSFHRDQLRALFQPYGTVTGAYIPTGDSGQPFGYGYVRMESEREAIAAMKGVDGTQIENSPIRVVLLSTSPFIVEVKRLLAKNPGKGFCDVCLMRYAPASPVTPIPILLDLLFRHFPIPKLGCCADCRQTTLVVSG